MPLVDNAWYASTTAWSAVTAWTAGATHACGDIIRQNAAPAVGSERVFACVHSTGGNSTSAPVTEPTWTVTRGAKTTDNTNLTWQEATGVAALNGDLTNTPDWNAVKNTAVILGQVIKNIAGTLVLICTTAGTAGNAAEPSWAAFTTTGATTTDNTVTWTTLGASFAAWAAPSKTVFVITTTTWVQAGNTVFVADNTAESNSGSATVSFTNNTFSTPANPIKILSVDHTAGVPPTSVLAGATVTTTGSGSLNLCNQSAGSGYYLYGITFNQGVGQSINIIMTVGAASGSNIFDSCKLIMSNTSGGTCHLQIGSTTSPALYTKLYNTTLKFGATGQFLGFSGVLDWINTPSAIDAAGAIPTSVILTNTGGSGQATFRGVDFSAVGSGHTLVSGTNGPVQINFIDCKLGATLATKVASLSVNSLVHFVRTDSSGTNYVTEKDNIFGAQTTETTIVRAGGAQILAQNISWKIVTTSSSNWISPFAPAPMQINNPLTATNVTVTVYGVWGGGAVPNNDDIWFEAEYLGASSSPLGSFINSSKPNVLATGSAVSSDSSTWGGSTTPFKMSVTLSSPQPALAGPISVRVLAAKASTTFYIDPQPELS
jgi:hypothetical protein